MWSVVNKQANIDLLFRNGLKDFEVLPPPEVWDNIRPAIRRKQLPLIILRSAALIAVLFSISFLAYRMSRLPGPAQNPFLSFDQGPVRPRPLPADPVLERLMPASDRQASPVMQNQIAEPAPEPELNNEESASQPALDIFTETSNLNYQSNIIIPSGIRSVMSTDYTKDNSASEISDLNSPAFEELKSKTDRWSLTAMASPTYYMRPDLSSSDMADQVSSLEQSRISYSGGLSFSYKISRKLSIQSGLYYSSIGNKVDDIRSYAGFSRFDYTKGDHNFEVMTTSGPIFTSNPDVFLADIGGDRVVTRYTNDVFDPGKANLSYINSSLFQNLSYLEMPVFVRYKLIDKSLDFNLVGGLSYNLLINNSVHAMIDGSKYDIGKTAGLNSFMVSSSFGMGMEYNLSEKISLNLEPTFRYYLNPFSNIQSSSARPYSFGVFSGLSYRF